MKYDVFMRTRTYGGEYDWLNRPPYMPADIYKTCQSVIALREKQSFDHFSEEDWYGNFFFIRADGCSMLARMAKTKYSDSFGRSIFSFEGVCVKMENEKRFFLDIPNLINALLPPARSFRTQFEEEEAMTETFEADSPINPLKNANVPLEVHPAMRNNVAFRNLLNFIAHSDKPEGFIFGRNANAFSSYINKSALGIKHLFDFDNPEPVQVQKKDFSEQYKPLVCSYEPPVSIGTEKTAVYLFIQEMENAAYRYCWQVNLLDASSKKSSSRYATKFYNVTDRVSLSALELQKESVKHFLIENGWKKQEIGLRFEKEIYGRADEADE